jgi:hypothetical protein
MAMGRQLIDESLLNPPGGTRKKDEDWARKKVQRLKKERGYETSKFQGGDSELEGHSLWLTILKEAKDAKTNRVDNK